MEPDDISMKNLLYSLLSVDGSIKSQKVSVIIIATSYRQYNYT